MAIDRRTTAARALRRRQLVTDLGDEATLGAQRRALVELACRGRLYLVLETVAATMSWRG